ncbi:MAG TPA: glycosyltransferase family protein [Cytophagaceae bacterium]|jgi:spore coat polysaccharide biosynthesis protein SpsF|nr:glycosyltransferase family protein [Cytophagaceae bacterium]
MKIGCIIQARTSSTRLPEKVLKELPFNSGVSVLRQVIRRVKKSSKVNVIIIATTEDSEDEKIIDISLRENVLWFRGSKENVLERYYLAAKENDLDHVVRITSDCPCIDPVLIDHFIEEHLKENADYTSTQAQSRYPHGLDVEVMKFEALEKAYQQAKEDFEKEHVTMFMYRSRPDIFRIHTIEAPAEHRDSGIRITLDTKDDYTLLCTVFDYLYNKNEYFGVKEIFDLFKSKPWLKEINSHIAQKKVFNTLNEEIEEAIKILKLQDFNKASSLLKEYIRK